MGKQSVSNVKRVDFYTFDGCSSCEKALKDISPILSENNIPLSIKKHEMPGFIAPLICIIKEKDGKEKEECIEGYDAHLARDIEGLL